MTNTINIHQLDVERQVLCVLCNAGRPCSIAEIKEQLLAKKISLTAGKMGTFLSSGMRDSRKRLLKDGLVFRANGKYEIMRKGIDYLKRTVFVITFDRETDTHQTLEDLFADISGDVKLCDPYFDDKAYNLLKQYLNPQKINSIEVVCEKDRMNNSETYRIEKHSIVMHKNKHVHDRFLLDKNHLYLLGTSLNSIGGKLSFVVNLSAHKDEFEKIFQDLKNS